MLIKNKDGEPFFDLEAAKRNCGCFNANPQLHLLIVNQLREQNIETSAKFELKPLKTTNGLNTQVTRPKGAPKSILDDFDEVE